MKNAFLIHGYIGRDEYHNPVYPTGSNSHWQPWLSKQLQVRDIFTVAIEMPRPFQPRYDTWARELERYDITEDTILVGHSCGGGFLVRWLSENPNKKVGKVVLVAPWLDPTKDPDYDTADFFDFEMPENLIAQTKGLTIFNSDDDSSAVHDSVRAIRAAVTGVKYVEFSGKGHFCFGDMGTVEFPELEEECLR